MANTRDTRCISAAFDFLNAADFCHKCIRSDTSSEEGSSDFMSSPAARCEVKKSDSDSALLDYQEENVRNSEKLKVCLCENGVGAADLSNGDLSQQRSSDFLQGYIDRHTTSKGDKGQAGGEGKLCSSQSGGDAEAAVPKTGLSHNSVVVVNGSATGQAENLGAESCEKELVKASDINNCNSTVCDSHAELGTAEAVLTTEISSTTGAEDLGKDNLCGTSLSEQTTQTNGQGDCCTKSKASNREEEGVEEAEEVDVVMRPNRKSLNRRSTDTGLVSSMFNFLAPADSVFLPSRDSAVSSSDATCSSPEHKPHTLPSVAESGCPTEGQDPQAAEEGISVSISPQSSPHSSESGHSKDNDRVDGEGEVGKNGSCSSGNGQRSRSEEEEDVASVKLRRSRLSKQESVAEEEGSGDSSDEDAGVYSESFRRSNWIRIDDDGQLELAFPAVLPARLSSASRSSAASRSSGMSSDVPDFGRTPSPRIMSDEPPVFPEKCPSPRLYTSHKRSDSTSTTLSEREFKKEYVSRRKCLIQRQNSSKEYHRYSARVYDEEKSVVLEKTCEESDFGLHILDSQPAYITRVDPGSAADRAGVEEGQILVSVNGVNVLSSSHDDIVTLIVNSPSVVRIDVATSDFQPSRDLQMPIIQGHMQKQGSAASALMRRWKKRYFVLRQDSCLYYYKQKDDSDPLGAIPLAGYTFSRHLDSARDYCFKAEKYGARTYYFMTESRDEMTEWVGALSEAAARSKNRKDSFVSVSSHNVGLPALEVRRPECSGYLLKVGFRHKTWHRRYCILKDACLYYYKNVNSLSALGVVHLHGYKVDPFISIGKKHAFGLVPPVDTLRTFQFSAENETDRRRWVEAMIRSIQRWIQIDNDC